MVRTPSSQAPPADRGLHTVRQHTPSPVYIGDMHFHSFFASRRHDSRPLGPMMAAGPATLLSWALVGDLLWIERWRRGIRQKATPRQGEPHAWFRRELQRMTAHVAEQGLKIVRQPADVDQALAGVPHIVLAVEGASFIEQDVRSVREAYELGIRQLQLVHYIRNPLGDFQTTRPEHDGLTNLGKAVIRECNRLGMLIDLAHCSAAAVADALAISRAPMVWSHSSVATSGAPHWSMIAWKARQLTLPQARAIARQGGVIGVWALRQDVGATLQSYGDRMAQLAELIGEDHVGFGSDINGLGPFAVADSMADLGQVVTHWRTKGLGDARIRKLAIGNFARVLRAAMVARRG
ncbi:MAG: membrane dipeptidase [Hyphomicrobiaceae bacterium]|nr:membrane dipeptidase [Hyphomicrobiaceae bacterium]